MKNIICGIYNVMTKSSKDVTFNFRVRDDVRDGFRAVAHIRGASASTLLHQFMVKCIREEKEKDSAYFDLIETELQNSKEKSGIISVPHEGELSKNEKKDSNKNRKAA